MQCDLYFDEWQVIKDTMLADAEAAECLSRAVVNQDIGQQPDLKIDCDEETMKRILEVARRCCPAAVPRINMALAAKLS
jgi:hypothetical protein